MLLFVVASLWVIQALLAQLAFSFPFVVAVPLICLVPLFAGRIIARRGGSYFACFAIGVAMSGAVLVSSSIVITDFRVYISVLPGITIAAVPQGLAGVLGGWFAHFQARRHDPHYAPPPSRISALDATGCGMLLLGLWSIWMCLAWMGPTVLVFAGIVFATGLTMVIVAAVRRSRQIAGASWPATLCGSLAVLSVPPILFFVDESVSLHDLRDQTVQVCDRFEVLDWHVERNSEPEHPQMMVHVRAREDTQVRLSFVQLYDADGNYVALDSVSGDYPMIDLAAGDDAVLSAEMNHSARSRAGDVTLYQWALCTEPGIGTESCGFWGFGQSRHDVGPYCTTPASSP